MKREYMETPLGTLEIRAEGGKITEIHGLREGETKGAVEEDPIIAKARGQLQEYFDGKRKVFDLPLDMEQGTAFQQSVWKALEEIDFGDVVCYSDIAKAIGRPKSCRAVGNAVGANPFLIVVPCHRVVRGDGGLGGFSAGLYRKEILHELEGIKICKK